MRIYDCKTNHLREPLGFMMKTPVFSWKIDGAEGKYVSKSRVRVYEEEKPIFDSGFKEDIDRLAFEADIALKPRTAYHWTVETVSDAGETAVSDRNYFETGKMDEAHFGKWISAPETGRLPTFLKDFALRGKVRRARLYICGLGIYEAVLNGSRVGNEYLTPYCNNYLSWQQLITYDITDLLSSDNRLAVTVADGWWAGRFGFNSRAGHKGYYGFDKRLYAEIRLDYEDGESDCVATDGSWLVTRSNFTFSDIYDGEILDDTLPETAPEPALVLEDATDLLCDRMSPPIHIQQELKPIKLITTPKGEKVFDLGQNQAGIFRLKVDAPAGTKVHVQVGEVLQEGCFYRDNLRTAKAEYWYTSNGKPAVVQPKFTFYGYRYVKVDGLDNLKEDDLTGLVLHSDMDRTGDLVTGNKKVNRLIQNAAWGIRSNSLDVPTDCPQRDERMGWTGDAQVVSQAACRLFDMYSFYAKYLYDMYTEQKNLNGQVPDVVPAFGIKTFACIWGDACTVIPRSVYTMSGDKSILKAQYESMKAWVDWIKTVDGDDHNWRRVFHYGDWVALDFPLLKEDTCLGGTDEGFIADTAWADSCGAVAEAARILGYKDDARKYAEMQKHILDEVKKEFFTETGRCAIETQTGLLLTLKYKLSENKARILEQLDKRFTQTHGRLQTGFVGTAILNNTLSENERHFQAVDLLLNEEYPGWLYAVNLGATTIWERWNSMNPDGSVSSTGMNSFNHYAYGSIVEWMFRHLAGLQAIEPGYRKAKIAPMPDSRLGFIDMKQDAWRVRWEAVSDKRLKLSVTVPFDCTAYLELPYASGLEKKGNPIFERMEGDLCVLSAGSYEIEYDTDRVMKRVFSVDDTMDELLTSLDGRLALNRVYPKVNNVSSIMRKRKMREIIPIKGGDQALIDLVDRALKGEA